MKIRTLLAGVLLVLLASSVAHAQAWNDSATTLYVGERAYYEFTADTDSGALHVGRNGSVVYGFDQDIVGTDTDADAAIVTCATPTTVVGSCILAVDLTADVSGGIITPAHEWIRVRVDVAPGSGTAQVVLLGGEAAAVSTVSPTFTGTVTADGVDIRPDADDGGSVVLKECEGGTGCPAADAGHSLTHKLLDGAESLGEDKLRYGFRECAFFANDTAIQFDNGKCIPNGYSLDGSVATLKTCNYTTDPGATSTYSANCFASGSVALGNCFVYVQDNDFDQDGDQIVLTAVAVDLEAGDTVGSDLAADFTIKDVSQSCGADTNCIGDGDEYTKVWEIQEMYDFVKAEDRGYVVIKATITNTGANDGIDLMLSCEVM